VQPGPAVVDPERGLAATGSDRAPEAERHLVSLSVSHNAPRLV